MQKATITFVVAAVCLLLGGCQQGIDTAQNSCIRPTDARDGWHLGVMAWTFTKFTFYEAIDKTAAMDMHYIQGSPGQVLSNARPGIKFSPDMPAEVREEIKQKLAQAGVRMESTWAELPEDKAVCRKVFEFCRDMGINVIVTEEPAERYAMLDELCREYNIKVAIHNHPKPSKFWHPDRVLEACQGRSKFIGACADTGHWMRSGINPVEALKKLEGRIVCLHFKDLNEFGNPDAHDVMWGTGAGDVEAMLTELHKQNYKGEILFEYEYNWRNSMPEIEQSVQYYNKVAGRLQADFRGG